MKKTLAVSAMLGAMGLSVAVYAADSSRTAAHVSRLLKTRLPRTEVSLVDCTKVAGICEVVAGKSLFYTDHAARFLFVGRVYDMERRQDLTAAKLLELNPALLLGNAAAEGGAPESEGPSASAAALAADQRQGGRTAGPAAMQRVDVSGLPAAGAIVWGKPAGIPVTVFTDFQCGYCRALAAQLEQMNVKVIERPISTLGSRDTANRVLCAREPLRALKAAYNREPLPPAQCDTAGLDANEAFARTHGFAGTPVLVRSDGAVLEGFRPREVLETWLAGSR